jgi:hypothetical protein
VAVKRTNAITTAPSAVAPGAIGKRLLRDLPGATALGTVVFILTITPSRFTFFHESFHAFIRILSLH